MKTTATSRPSLGSLLKRYRWLYLLGWLFLALIALLAQWLGPALFEQLRWLVDQMAPSASLGWKIALVVVALIVVPMAAGIVAQFLLGYLKGRNGSNALLQMQEKLFAEIEPGDERGYQVALLAWPNPQVRTLALVTTTFEESATGRQLAAVYLPGTPDPTKGSIKVVALDDLTLIGWTLDNVTSFHLTFGSVSPGSC
ncbi:MAG: hypothetical protein WBO53_18830 [Thermoanaerobaculia bacterium]